MNLRVAAFALGLCIQISMFAQEQVVSDPSQSMTASNQKIEAASVSAAAPSVSVVGDTLVFSASAYRLAEDASLEDLLKKIPGIEVNGNAVTLYGKQISELRVNGKRYFGGSVSAGLQNIPAEMIDKVGAYERESDFTRLTGVDDGELVPVLDLKIKQDFLDGWKGRVNGGYGTSGRYAVKANVNRMTKEENSSVVANFHNLPGKASFNNASRTQLGGGASGENDRREAGVSFARKTGNKEFDWNMQYQGKDSYVQSLVQTQNIYAATTSFSNANNSNSARMDNPKADLRFQFRPDKWTTVMVRPAVSWSRTDNWTHNLTGNFKRDPYELVADPCSEIGSYGEGDPLASVRASTADNMLRGFSDRLDGRITLLWSRKFSKRGRSVSLQTDDSFVLQNSDQGTNYRTVYNRTKAPTDTTRRQYIDQDTRNLAFSLQRADREGAVSSVLRKGRVQGQVGGAFPLRSYPE